MGIPKFYSSAVRPLFGFALESSRLPSDPTALYIDGNAIAHYAMGQAFGYDLPENLRSGLESLSAEQKQANGVNYFIQRLQQISISLKPKTLVIAMDGLVPASKENQQRTRRYRSNLFRRINLSTGFDTAAISSGTPLMESLHVRLLHEINSNTASFGTTRIIYSSHKRVGEGEIIIQKLIAEGKIPKTGVHVIYGLDSDFFVLGGQLGVENVYLARNRLDKFISLNIFYEELEKKYNITRREFPIVMNYAGNDHLPRTPLAFDIGTGFTTLLNAYKDLSQKLVTETADIDWKALSGYNRILADKEKELLSTPEYKGANILLNADSYEKQRNMWYTQIFSLKGSMELASYVYQRMGIAQLVKTGTPTQERVNKLVQTYQEMFAWVYNYYTGKSNSCRYDVYYNFVDAPLMADISALDYYPKPEAYLREPDSVTRWEIEQLLDSLNVYELREVIPWLVEQGESKQKGDWVRLANAEAARIVSLHLHPRRMMTQLFLTIPPSSLNVLDVAQRTLLEERNLSNNLRPINYLIKTSDVNLSTNITSQELLKVASAGERDVYLPKFDYWDVLGMFLKTKNMPKSLIPDPDVFTVQISESALSMSLAGSRAAALNLSGRGGVTPKTRRSTLQVRT